MSTSKHVMIIGAGTGGLCLAQGLKRAGISVAVYERDRTRADGLFGFRVGISPDGKRGLRACLSPELYDIFLATCARRATRLNMLTEQFGELLSIPFGESTQQEEKDHDESVSRMTLRQVLLTGVEDITHFGKRFTHYEQHSDGTVTAFFDDGTSDTGDLLVGADGSRSNVRKQYLPHAELASAGTAGITGKLPLTEQTRALLPPRVFNGVSLVLPPRGYNTIIHVMEFNWNSQGSPKHGIGDSEADLLNKWPGLLYDNTRDYIMWGFSGAFRNLPSDVLQLPGVGLQEVLLERTRSWHPNLRELFRLAEPSTIFPLHIRTSEPVPQWKTTNVTLIGDAIHTMTPGRGVGANTALRDARLLFRNLTNARSGAITLLEAVRDYETKMLDYAFDAVAQSRKQGTGNDLVHRPVIGRLGLAGARTGMRFVNHLPPIKRRMAEAETAFRNTDEDD